MNNQERELQDVLDQYRKVSSERDSAESRYRVSSDETQTMRNELIAADSDRKRYSDKIAVLERDIAGHLHVSKTLGEFYQLNHR